MKLKLVAIKGGACEACGYKKSLRALVFHHRDPKLKEFSFSSAGVSFERAVEELKKCDLLCCNCHAEEHEKLDAQSRNRTLIKPESTAGLCR